MVEPGLRILRNGISRLKPLNRSAAFTPLPGSNALPQRLLKRRKRRAPIIRFVGNEARPLRAGRCNDLTMQRGNEVTP